MPDWPSFPALTLHGPGFISGATAFGSGLNTTASASAAWPSANLAIFIPFRIPRPVIVYRLATGSGATAAGNFDIGIYDKQGNRLVSSGATAKGASEEHIINVTDTYLGEGLYYLAMAADGTNNYVMLTPFGTTPVPLQRARLYGTLEVATAYPLPATVSMVARTTALIPDIAAYTRDY